MMCRQSAGPGVSSHATVGITLLFLVLSASVFAEGEITFQAPVSFYQARLVATVAATDTNNDDKDDLVIGCSDPGTDTAQMAHFLGNGDGTFSSAVYNTAATFTASLPIDVTVGDFNGDERPDVALINGSAMSKYYNDLYVYLNNGSGAFSNGIHRAVPLPYGIVCGDFNQDHKLDVLVGQTAAATVYSYFQGNGDGSFADPATYSLGRYGCGMDTGDFNLDGKLDFVCCDHQYNGFVVGFGQGNGTFSLVGTYMLSRMPWLIAAGDFNNDGAEDVVATIGTGSTSLGIGATFTNMGDGVFTARQFLPTGPQPRGLAVADFDGDGKMDIASAMGDANTIWVLRGKGNMTFHPPLVLTTSGECATLATGDFNGDGKTDLVTCDVASCYVRVLLNTSPAPASARSGWEIYR